MMIMKVVSYITLNLILNSMVDQHKRATSIYEYFYSYIVITANPNITISTGQNEFVSVSEGGSINISCTSTGAPVPSITWVLNNQPTNYSQTDIVKDNHDYTATGIPGYVVSILHIVHAQYEVHVGVYECISKNSVDESTDQYAAKITVQVNGMYIYLNVP